MKNQWQILGITAGVIIVMFVAFIFQQRQTPPPEQAQKIEYEFETTANQPAMENPPPASAPSLASQAPEAGKYAIQVASLSERAKADAASKKVNEAGLSAYVASVDLGTKGTWHRIYVGPFMTKEEAGAMLPAVKAHYKDSFIIAVK